ncbi:MAG TPA: hypothetical protein VGF17_05595, partial [Phytomonospora sp.]
MIYEDETARDRELDAAAETLRARLDAADEAVAQVTPEEVEERLRRFLDARRAAAEAPATGPDDPFAAWAGFQDPDTVPAGWTLAEGPVETDGESLAHVARIQAEAERLRLDAMEFHAQMKWYRDRGLRFLDGALEQAAARIAAAKREAASIVEEARRHAAQIREEARAEAAVDDAPLVIAWQRERRQVVVLDSCFASHGTGTAASDARAESLNTAGRFLASLMAALGGTEQAEAEERRRVCARGPRALESPLPRARWETAFLDLESRV